VNKVQGISFRVLEITDACRSTHQRLKYFPQSQTDFHHVRYHLSRSRRKANKEATQSRSPYLVSCLRRFRGACFLF
jgi:hypothetical protein